MDQEIIDWRGTSNASLANMFSLLAIRLGSYWRNDSFTHQTSDQFFCNYVGTLGKIEQFMEQVRLNLVPDSEEYELQLKSNQNQYIEQITSYFDHLRYVPVWFGTVELSVNANIFFKCVDVKAHRFLSKPFKESEFRLEVDPEQPQMLRRKSYTDFISTDLENYREELFSTLKYISTQLCQSNAQQAFINCKEKAILDKVHAEDYVNRCFDTHSNLYVLCMDLGYLSDETKETQIKGQVQTDQDNQGKLNDNKAYTEIKGALDRLGKLLATDVNVIGYIQKLEFFPPKGYSAFSVFLLKGDVPVSEDYWANFIGEKWRLAAGEQGAFHNCNPEFRLFSKDSVGTIKVSHTKKRKELVEWVVTYVAKSGEFLTATVPEADMGVLFKLGKEPWAAPISAQSLKQTRNKQPKQPEKLEDIKIPDKIWKIPKTAKSKADKIIASRINDISVIYPELLAQNKSYLELFIKIEIFMACLNRYDGLGFDDSHYSNLSIFDRFKYGSVIGQQLWDIDRTWGLVELVKRFRSYPLLGNLSNNLLIFFKSLSESPLYFPIEPSMSQLMAYNNIIIRIRADLKAKPKPQIVIQRDGFRYEDGIENALDIVSSNLCPSLSNSSVSESKETVGDLFDIRNKTADDTYESAKIYVQKIFKQDVLLLGFNFSVSHRTDHIPATLIAKLLDAFREYGKKDKSLKSLLGYIGHQTITNSQSQEARVILFLDASENRSIDSSVKQVINYWTQLMQKKLVNPAFQKSIHGKLKSTIPDWHQLTTSITPFPIFKSVEIFTSTACYINTTDKSKQQEFIDKVVLFMVKQPLYNPSIAQGLTKCLLKGHISHSSSTKEPKPAKPKKTKTKTASVKKLAAPEVVESLEKEIIQVEEATLPDPELIETLEQEREKVEETTLPEPVVQIDSEVINPALNHLSSSKALSFPIPIKEEFLENSMQVDVHGMQEPIMGSAAQTFAFITQNPVYSSDPNKTNE